ncbi:MAG: hypothetical protein ACI4RM_04880 [Ruminococcus sp.]
MEFRIWSLEFRVWSFSPPKAVYEYCRAKKYSVKTNLSTRP